MAELVSCAFLLADSVEAVGTEDGAVVRIDRPHKPPLRFRFHTVFGPGTTQAEVYTSGVSACVDAVLSGYNATVFAYG